MKAATAALAVATVFFGALPCRAQAGCTRAIESGFSHCPPAGWTVKAPAALGDKFKIFLGPRDGQFTRTVNFQEETDARSLPDHVAASIRTMVESPAKAGAEKVTVLAQTEFPTASGERGVKLVIHVITRSLTVRAFQYYFSAAGNRKLVGSCMGLAAAAELLEPVCDGAMKTFQIDP